MQSFPIATSGDLGASSAQCRDVPFNAAGRGFGVGQRSGQLVCG